MIHRRMIFSQQRKHFEAQSLGLSKTNEIYVILVISFQGLYKHRDPCTTGLSRQTGSISKATWKSESFLSLPNDHTNTVIFHFSLQTSSIFSGSTGALEMISAV